MGTLKAQGVTHQGARENVFLNGRYGIELNSSAGAKAMPIMLAAHMRTQNQRERVGGQPIAFEAFGYIHRSIFALLQGYWNAPPARAALFPF